MFGGQKAVPLGHQQLTLNGAAGLTIPTGANAVVFNAETQNVRWRDDGTDPTTTVGMLLKTTDYPVEYHPNLKALKFIQATAGAILNVAYYRLAGF